MNTHTWKNIVINPYIALLILLGIYPYGLSFIEQEYVFYLGVVIISIVSCVLLRLQGFGEILRFRSFSWKTIGELLLGFFALIAWAMVIHELFPLPANQQAINEQQYVWMELFIFNAYAMIVGPIGEELVFRGLLMKNLEKISIFSLEALVSASLFSMGHTLLYGWSVTDFMTYFGMGCIYAFLFKKSETIYPAICLHILWNSFVLLLINQ